MKIIKIEANKAKINLSENEIFAVRQAFFIARHSKIENFEQTIGVTQEEAKELMLYFQDLGERINPNSVAKTIINRKNCNLRSQDYDFCFYMIKMHTEKKNVKLGITLQKKGTGEIIVKTAFGVVSINQLHIHISSLRDGVNLLSNQTDTQISFSFLSEIVYVNINNVESNKIDGEERDRLNIEFVFQQGKQISAVDSKDSPETRKENPFNTPKSFSSTLTLENLTNFITKVEDFFENRVNNNLN